jgi:hypothetical protein
MTMKSRFSCRFIWFFTLVWLLASLGNAIAAGAKGTATAKDDSRSPVPDPLILVQYTEAKEKAFSLLIPKGWKTEGGIFFVDPNTAGGSANSTAPKVNFSVKKDDAGTVMLQLLGEDKPSMAISSHPGVKSEKPNGAEH